MTMCFRARLILGSGASSTRAGLPRWGPRYRARVCNNVAFAPAGRDVYSYRLYFRFFSLQRSETPGPHFAPLERRINLWRFGSYKHFAPIGARSVGSCTQFIVEDTGNQAPSIQNRARERRI